MSIQIKLTEDVYTTRWGTLAADSIIEVDGIDSVHDAFIVSSEGFREDWIFKNQYEVVVEQNEYIQRIEKLEAEIERLKKLVPETAFLPQENGVYGDTTDFYVRFGPDKWVAVFVGQGFVEARTDDDMVREAGTDLGEKLI